MDSKDIGNGGRELKKNYLSESKSPLIDDDCKNATTSTSSPQSTPCLSDNVSLENELVNDKKSTNLFTDRSKKKSLTFTGMSFILTSLVKPSTARDKWAIIRNAVRSGMLCNPSGVSEMKRLEIKACVYKNDIELLKLICIGSPPALQVASIEAIEQLKNDVLASILDFCALSTDKTTINFFQSSGAKILAVAVKNESYLSSVRFLLEKGVSPNELIPGDICSAMHAAAKAGNTAALEIMHKEYNGDINLGKDTEKESVLHLAVLGDSTEVIRYLLSNGVETASKNDKHKCMPLHLAAEHNFSESAEILLENGAFVDATRNQTERETALHVAASRGHFDMCDVLIKWSANVNALKKNSVTPLHLACDALANSIVQLLIIQGATVDAKDHMLQTPLHYAINSQGSGASKTIRLLLRNGADINLADILGNTPLHQAAMQHKLSRVTILIESGADLYLVNKLGKTAFYTAVQLVPNSLKVVEKLLDKCLTFKNINCDMDPEIKLDFSPIVPRKVENSEKSVVGLFLDVLDLQQIEPTITERLLLHPLSEGYLQLKWFQIKRLYYFGLVLTHLIYSIVYSVYAILVFKNLCQPELGEPILSKVVCDFKPSRDGWEQGVRVIIAQISWFFLMVLSVMYAVKECTRCIHLKHRYLMTMESYLNFLVLLSVFLITFYVNPFQTDLVTVYRWQYHACTYGVFMTWLLQMFLIGKVPRFGKYVEMVKNVVRTLSNFFVAYIFLFIAFTVSFYILFPSHAPFREVFPAALIKVLDMMLGELGYDDIYYPSSKTLNLTMSSNVTGYGFISETTLPQYFPFTANIMLTLFVIFVSIIIMNLLFGLAVTDIQALYKVARLHQLIQQIGLITYIENIILTPGFNYLPKKVQEGLNHMIHGLPGSSKGELSKTIKMGDYVDTSLSLNLKKRVLDYCNQLYKQGEYKTALEKDVDAMREQLNGMEAMIKILLDLSQQQSNSRRSSNRDETDGLETGDVTNDNAVQKSGMSLAELTNAQSLSKIAEEVHRF